MCVLCVDDFGVEYAGKEQANHLLTILKEHYEVTVDWDGNKYLGIYLEWNYTKGTVRMSMKNYIKTVL